MKKGDEVLDAERLLPEGIAPTLRGY